VAVSKKAHRFYGPVFAKRAFVADEDLGVFAKSFVFLDQRGLVAVELSLYNIATREDHDRIGSPPI